jgi:hypothetical protein
MVAWAIIRGDGRVDGEISRREARAWRCACCCVPEDTLARSRVAVYRRQDYFGSVFFWREIMRLYPLSGGA